MKVTVATGKRRIHGILIFNLYPFLGAAMGEYISSPTPIVLIQHGVSKFSIRLTPKVRDNNFSFEWML